MDYPSNHRANGRPRVTARRSRRGQFCVALAGVLILAMTSMVDARSRGSMGSRGSRTYDAPPTTQTAPSTAQPLQRSQTTPSQAQPRSAAPATAAQPAQGRFGGGFFAGMLGAGLLGVLFGAGLFGGLGSLASILGFLVQVALIGGLVYLAISFFRRRQQPAMAGPHTGAAMQRSTLGDSAAPGGAVPAGRGVARGGASARRPRTEDVALGPDDFAAFERALEEVQMAYGREDVAALWTLATPEMAGYFQEELNDRARSGVRGAISDIKLLQGDLAEAWREGTTDYATVAMRYAITEQMVERTSGKATSGEPATADEVTEIWTFRRDNDGPWKLSAIQQVA